MCIEQDKFNPLQVLEPFQFRQNSVKSSLYAPFNKITKGSYG
jgi:hypothetical protein